MNLPDKFHKATNNCCYTNQNAPHFALYFSILYSQFSVVSKVCKTFEKGELRPPLVFIIFYSNI